MALRRYEPSFGRKPQQRVNDMIRVPQVRVIAEDGTQLGIMNTIDAIARARESDLDLVEVASQDKPPVCRIMDFGKFKYLQKKKQSKQAASSHQTKIKELRLRPKIGEHDIQVRLKQAREFLGEKDKVTISVQFKGREMAHVSEGMKVLEHFLQMIDDIAKVETPPKQFGKRITCMVVPK